MAYQVKNEWREGVPQYACHVCGLPYHADEMVYADDRRWYCQRTCWDGKTVTGEARERAEASKMRREEKQPPYTGRKADWWP